MFSRLFNTQKSGDQVNTQKYRNSTLIKKKKSDRIGIGDTQNFLDQIWKNGIVASLFFTQVFLDTGILKLIGNLIAQNLMLDIV